jgi:hypothetical protein
MAHVDQGDSGLLLEIIGLVGRDVRAHHEEFVVRVIGANLGLESGKEHDVSLTADIVDKI